MSCHRFPDDALRIEDGSFDARARMVRVPPVGATRVADVHLGGRMLADAPVLVADLPVFEAFGVADRPAIILGLDWLDKTRMVIDFPGRQVWFEAAKIRR